MVPLIVSSAVITVVVRAGQWVRDRSHERLIVGLVRAMPAGGRVRAVQAGGLAVHIDVPSHTPTKACRPAVHPCRCRPGRRRPGAPGTMYHKAIRRPAR